MTYRKIQRALFLAGIALSLCAAGLTFTDAPDWLFFLAIIPALACGAAGIFMPVNDQRPSWLPGGGR